MTKSSDTPRSPLYRRLGVAGPARLRALLKGLVRASPFCSRSPGRRGFRRVPRARQGSSRLQQILWRTLHGHPLRPGSVQGTTGVAVNDETGDVYVADKGNNRIEQFSSSGAFIVRVQWGLCADGCA